MMKHLFAGLLLCGAAAAETRAQLYIGPAESLTVKSGETFSVDSLVLKPTADFGAGNVALTHHYTPDTTPTGAGIARVYEWSGAVNFTGTLGLFYTSAELNGAVASNLEIAYHDGSAWTTTSGSNSATAAHFVSNGFALATSVVRITAAPSATPLSIRLISFHAAKRGEDAVLSWKATAAAGDHFDVEHSADGRQFRTIGSVSAQGSTHEYGTTHERPGGGAHYYRLKVVDASGGVAYSAVRVVAFGADAGVVLYPNPAVSAVFISGLDVGDVVRVLDAAGRVVAVRTASGGMEKIDVAAWPAAPYAVQVARAGAVVQRLRFVRR